MPRVIITGILAPGALRDALVPAPRRSSSGTISTASPTIVAAPVMVALADSVYRDRGVDIKDLPAGDSSTNASSAVVSGDTNLTSENVDQGARG